MASNFTELDDSPRERIGIQDLNETEIIRQFKGPWDEKLQFLEDLVNNQVYPEYPTAVIKNVEFSPATNCPIQDTTDRVLNVNRYEEAMATVTYGVLTLEEAARSGGDSSPGSQKRFLSKGKFEQRPDGVLTVEVGGRTEIQTIKTGGGVEWEVFPGTQVPVNFGTHYPIQITEYKYTLTGSEEPDWVALDDVVGSVNKGVFKLPILGLRKAEETIHFVKYTASVGMSYVKAKPVFTWTLDMELEYRNLEGQPIWIHGGTRVPKSDNVTNVITWNHFYAEGAKPGWARLLFKAVDEDSAFDFGKGMFPIKSFKKVL